MLGLNLKLTIWDMTTRPNDDVVGGAVITGTPAYTNVSGRMEGQAPDQIILQQGLETDRIWSVTIQPNTIAIDEMDEIEITSPANHRFFGKRFKVRSMRDTPMHPSDGRSYIELQVSHIEQLYN